MRSSALARAPARPRRKEPAEPPDRGVLFRHPSGARAKRDKPGFAWDLFLFAGLYGIPLFLRGLAGWGAAVLALWVIDLAAGWLAHRALWVPAQFALFLAFLGLQIVLGLIGNRLTARAYHARGWKVDAARDPAVRQALEAWRIERD